MYIMLVLSKMHAYALEFKSDYFLQYCDHYTKNLQRLHVTMLSTFRLYNVDVRFIISISEIDFQYTLRH